MDASKASLEQARPTSAYSNTSLWRRMFRLNMPEYWQDDCKPIKSEIFGIERLEAHARSLATAQTIAHKASASSHPLKHRLAENGVFLRKTDLAITEALQAGKQLTPAAQWLADNYALIDMQIRETSLDLSPAYYARLPKLASGPFEGLPRVFGVTWALIAHTDSHLQPDILCRYLLAYQSVSPLTVGELWAVPITLRIVLIENLRRTAHAIIENNNSRRAADSLADTLEDTRKEKKPDIQKVLASIDPVTLTPAFVARLVHRSRRLDAEKDPVLVWLGQRLADKKSSIEDTVRDDLQEQGAFNATIRNIITSLRMIAGQDWSEIFEQVCLIDKAFADYPSFTESDFASRDLYRKAIEDLALGSKESELDIAYRAIALAKKAQSTNPADPRRSDPGYYLLMEERFILEEEIGFRSPLSRKLVRNFCRHGITGYSIAVFLLSFFFLSIPISISEGQYSPPLWLAVIIICASIPTSEAAIACINRLALRAVKVTMLPGLELLQGVPSHLRTIVVIPVLLTNEKTIKELLARLEMHYLATHDKSVHFALLSDWKDSDDEHAPDDDVLLQQAADGIKLFNQRFGSCESGDRFLLLHRRRIWSESEGVWMGWERKRGKLHELNRLLRGATDTTFLEDPYRHIPQGVRYVVTLDADTRLPLETVRRLVGKIAHPLNVAQFNPETRRVEKGYAILQPRVTPSLPVGHQSTLFQKIYSTSSGIDAYSAAISDLYQDMFGEGSYAGKGIYDIDAFEAALAGRVPEASLLSHDLFEGIFARAGLASDIEVVEEFPTDYLVSSQRLHRWTRGDWQLLPWIISGTAKTTHPHDRLSGIARWKMLDNLRRTLWAPFTLLTLLACWFLLPENAAIWTLFVLVMAGLPAFLPVLPYIFPRREWITLRSYLSVIASHAANAGIMTALNLTFMAHQAFLMADAISRTLVRVFITRRFLLQWVPAAQTVSLLEAGMKDYYIRMLPAPVFAGLITAYVVWSEPETLLLSGPLAVLWGLSPALALWTSRSPIIPSQSRPSRTDIRTLRLAARRTWFFFETFVTPSDNMLPPDNFQEDPSPVLARRTSPTNIGLYLLCTISARDFGWCGLQETVERLEATLETVEKLQKYRGHLYNWYSTETLSPLNPLYVSTVDSGNLAGHLITVASTCREWLTQTPPNDDWRAGLSDAITIAIMEITFRNGERLPLTKQQRVLLRSLGKLKSDVLSAPQDKTDRSLAALIKRAETIATHAAHLFPAAKNLAEISSPAPLFWATSPLRALESHLRDLSPSLQAGLSRRLQALEHHARQLADDMDFSFLRDSSRKLLSIGFLVPEDAMDSNCYDLLASEARLAVYFAIAKGDVPARDWFRLGRAITPSGSGAALISWSGSMFEYLMPSLVMRAPIGSLLQETNALIVQRQIAYGQSRNIPWGISESAYNVRDLEYTYQYSNFGVPGLGLKRGLAQDMVVAPYATMLAAMIDPQKAVANLIILEKIGARGRYGFYEALDYTPERVPEDQTVAIVHAYMAHHQGMSILAVADTVLNGIMRARFHDDPVIASAELLLQERAPDKGAVARPLPTEQALPPVASNTAARAGRYYDTAYTQEPVTHLLSNGRYTVMLTSAGSGYSNWQGQMLTRWREDRTLDHYGAYFYLKNLKTGYSWSAGIQPCGTIPDDYLVAFHEDRAEFSRRDGFMTTTLDIMVSAEDDAEVRHLTLSNTGHETVEIDITSYAELALLSQDADLAHPAFTKLFVQTEYLPETKALIATRRRRSPDEPEIWVAHLVVSKLAVSMETDRAAFIGRGQTLRSPAAMIGKNALSGRTGTVLDASFSLRCRATLKPGSTTRISFWTMAASSREKLLDLIDTHKDAAALDRVRTLAWTQAQIQLRHLDITPPEADLFQRLAAHVLFSGSSLRAPSEKIRLGAGPQKALWEHGISGDLPLVVLSVKENSDTDIVRQILLAHEYFRLKQLAIDLVILNDHPSSYMQDLQTSLENLVRSLPKAATGGGSVRILRTNLLAPSALALLLSVARVVLKARDSLVEQLDLAESLAAQIPPSFLPSSSSTPEVFDIPSIPELEFFNGYGGFADNGKAYVVVMAPGKTTPAPWINVIANENFGFQATAEGSGHTWAHNSREHQITPWSNDPVSNPPGEVFYLRDEETRTLWCLTAATRRDAAATYVTHHGRGYTRYERIAHGIASTLLQYVPTIDPIKLSRIQLHNLSGRPRTLSITSYVEWVLGSSRTKAASFITTETDPETGALFARNRWDDTYGARVAFADLGSYVTTIAGDRTAFMGRNGSLDNPRAFTHPDGLQSVTGAGLDPCGIAQTLVTLPANGRVEIVFLLGEAADETEARNLITQYRNADLDVVLQTVTEKWNTICHAVQVRTPDRSMDIMLNGWLLYQTLSSRVLARAGFYQASGAFGFRDQLQDGMALALSSPALVRNHLLRAASRQFAEGDVQHWWLPQTGAGVRTHISDDCTWLACTVAHYVVTTGETAVLDETVGFLEAPPLPLTEHDHFMVPALSSKKATLFEHCARALDHSLSVGTHGLPLMGTGDWNDGMNRVGEQGRGESVWLGWFLYSTLKTFIPLALERHDTVRATRWQNHTEKLACALERAWDGDWYIRAYFDDGTPLGSHNNTECQIDAISQSWAVLSGAASPERAHHAIHSALQRLVRPDDGLILVLTPPFDKATPDPGYIRGYPPGVRENGGQYTHAALWTVMAIAALGDGNQAHALFSMINPIHHSLTQEQSDRYKLEPYVVAADIYSEPPHNGRGGWSWYTGSAGWMQRVGIESILGIRIEGEKLLITPCIPREWPEFEVTLRWRSAQYKLLIKNPNGVSNNTPRSIVVDDVFLENTSTILLRDDGVLHLVTITL
ncbi:GH36-type glycosyl hydrolase domain-containing protein [Acetobacter tropicalis]|uniref:GH36-type glycosyl hydrolase domain-containing protein n=1 Tax=Acetobacter tropicalis TaxID=104102 RepID=UPI0039766CE4